MLYELAFTPSIFDHEMNDGAADWLECLRTIGRAIRPSADTPNRIVVSDLYSDGTSSGWEQVSRQLVEAIPRGHSARETAMALLGRMKSIGVDRDPVGDWPGDDEDAWINEACLSHAMLAFRCLVAIDPTSAVDEVTATELRSVLGNDFWDGCGPVLTPQGSSQEQADIVAGLAYHADFLELVLPYGNEQEFGCEVVRAIDCLPQRKRPRLVRVHSRSIENPQARGNFLVNSCNVNPARTALSWCFWPGTTLRDRVAIAGRVSYSGDAEIRGARWGLYMGHVPWDGMTGDGPPSQWSLMIPSVSRQHLDVLSDHVNLSRAVRIAAPR